MPRCDCAGGQCSCVVLAGSGTTVTGAGSSSNPYIISADPTIPGRLRVADTSTVDMSATGNGTADDPLVISADAQVSLDELTDVSAASPAVGDTISWNGQEWVTGAPPVVPPGAVNVGPGLTGDGSVATPVAAAVSGVWGTPPLDVYGDNSTTGLAIYVDANGQLRAEPRDTSGEVTWDEIVGKPSAFPTTWDQVSGKPTLWDVSSDTTATTVATGWQVLWASSRNRGGITTASVRMRRTGGTISVPSSGNVGNTVLCRLTNPALRPFQYGNLTTSSSGATMLAYINDGGQIILTSTVPNASITTGTEFVLTGTWVSTGN